MNVLITGYSGFAGHHLIRFLSSKNNADVRLFGVERREPVSTLYTNVTTFQADICDLQAMTRIIKDIRPDFIFNLAGIAYIPQANESPDHTLQVNAYGVREMLEIISKFSPHTKTLLVSSSEVYGRVGPQDLPLTENSPIQPHHVYGQSKALMERLALEFVHTHEIRVHIVRAFNHIGAYQSDNFVVSSFSRQIARIKLGKDKPILKVGNLEPKRDFIDVEDVMRSYWVILNDPKADLIYNVCSGMAYSIQEIVEKLMDLSGVSCTIERDPTRYRVNDLPILLGSHEKLTQELHWRPEIPINHSLQTTLDYWLEYESKI